MSPAHLELVDAKIAGLPIAAAAPLAHTHFWNADRFLAQHSANLRYVPKWKAWLVWDGRRFARDDSNRIHELAKITVRSIPADLPTTADSDARRALLRWAGKSESARTVHEILELASSDARVVRTPADFDADPDVLNVQNGLLELRTGTLRPHSRDDHCTRVVDLDWLPGAPCDRFEAYLARVVPDAEVRDMLRIAVGYSLTGHTREQCLFLLWGTGRNGKSVFQEVLRRLAGEYGVRADFSTFLDAGPRAAGGARNDLARLAGARLVCTSEASENQRLNESLIKSITGGDTITARRLYESEVEFTPEFALWMAANHRPVIRGTDLGIWRRMRLIPFVVAIPEDEVDPALLETLEGELPGILAWAVSGAIEWYRVGLPAPAGVLAATEAYREESDVLGEFLADRCTVDPAATVAAAALHSSYREWSDARGDTPLSAASLGRKLTDRGFPTFKNAAGSKSRRGLLLRVVADGCGW